MPMPFSTRLHAACRILSDPKLFFRKIIEIESFALRAAILHECQNYLGGGGGLGGSEKNHLEL